MIKFDRRKNICATVIMVRVDHLTLSIRQHWRTWPLTMDSVFVRLVAKFSIQLTDLFAARVVEQLKKQNSSSFFVTGIQRYKPENWIASLAIQYKLNLVELAPDSTTQGR